ncbi:trypsin-like peptidase domain-containing protein [Dokdonella sp.]|uniref:S1C family serine protease n=1 Tax=Dokdonella sp. TaxID=2291710 RepID=UPI001B0CC592|nr:trypsin-like peptidase domain-containing protein [Dokdonella sp.]MBO9663711.1 trypsin-like peptidase domain-containing protein [Dokdonella sp.]
MRSRNLHDTLAFVARCVVVGLAAAFVVNLAAPGLVGRLRGSVQGERTRDAADATSRHAPFSYADAVARASPAVVNIYANRTTLQRRIVQVDPLTQRLLGLRGIAGPWEKRLDRSLGSGVIFSSDGYVLTNNHVINGADDIQVLLDDGRVSKAQIIGSDVETDLAVLKIDAGSLPEIAVPDDKTADVGDVVLAIGNPVGLGKTVTMGIVSATGRQLKMSAYEDFIQTDAAINAGNSGGALVNADGELIGINTAVYPRTPTSDGSGAYRQVAEGIGFAIPVTTAKTVLDQIVKHGHVIRGWIGTDYIDVPPPNGATSRPQGVLVTRVIPESPAAQAGLQPYDLLLKLDGAPIVDQIDLRNREAMLAPGTKVRLEGLRNNAPFAIDVTLAQRPAPSTTGA